MWPAKATEGTGSLTSIVTFANGAMSGWVWIEVLECHHQMFVMLGCKRVCPEKTRVLVAISLTDIFAGTTNLGLISARLGNHVGIRGHFLEPGGRRGTIRNDIVIGLPPDRG